jgi:hypothetical protein
MSRAWADTDRRYQREIDRAGFTETQKLILRKILYYSIPFERMEMVVPMQRALAIVCGLDEGDVSRTLVWLENNRVIERGENQLPVAGAMVRRHYYCIVPPPWLLRDASGKVIPDRVHDTPELRDMERWLENPGEDHPELFPQDPTLNDARREIFVESRVESSRESAMGPAGTVRAHGARSLPSGVGNSPTGGVGNSPTLPGGIGNSPTSAHVMHDHACNHVPSKQLHDMHVMHDMGVGKSPTVPGEVGNSPTSAMHEVGELGKRSTQELLQDIQRLCPRMAQQHLQHWQARIEREDAELVNAVIREGQLQQRAIDNMPGFLNATYLKAIRARARR